MLNYVSSLTHIQNAINDIDSVKIWCGLKLESKLDLEGSICKTPYLQHKEKEIKCSLPLRTKEGAQWWAQEVKIDSEKETKRKIYGFFLVLGKTLKGSRGNYEEETPWYDGGSSPWFLRIPSI